MSSITTDSSDNDQKGNVLTPLSIQPEPLDDSWIEEAQRELEKEQTAQKTVVAVKKKKKTKKKQKNKVATNGIAKQGTTTVDASDEDVAYDPPSKPSAASADKVDATIPLDGPTAAPVGAVQWSDLVEAAIDEDDNGFTKVEAKSKKAKPKPQPATEKNVIKNGRSSPPTQRPRESHPSSKANKTRPVKANVEREDPERPPES